MIILLGIFSSLGWGYMTWKKFLSDAEVLKDKDVQEYELMTKKFSGFSFKEGLKIYHHLKSTSKAEFIEKRFREYRSKWQENKAFRKEAQTREVEERKQQEKERERRSAVVPAELLPPEEKYHKKALLIRWESAPSWQKALLLREKCNKYLNMEKQSAGRRQNIGNLPTIITLTGSPGKHQLSAHELCGDMVPTGANDQQLEAALLAVREQMNYYFFVELLRELGIADTTYPSDYRLKRMAADLINYN